MRKYEEDEDVWLFIEEYLLFLRNQFHLLMSKPENAIALKIMIYHINSISTLSHPILFGFHFIELTLNRLLRFIFFRWNLGFHLFQRQTTTNIIT